MAKVGIVMGSDSDLKVMSKAASMLEKLGIDYEMTIISAHRLGESSRGQGNQGDYRRSRYGGAPSGNVRGVIPDAGDRRADVREEP